MLHIETAALAGVARAAAQARARVCGVPAAAAAPAARRRAARPRRGGRTPRPPASRARTPVRPRQVAALVGADWRDVVPGANATSLAGAVIASLELRPGDLLLMSNATYPAVRGARALPPQHTAAGARAMAGCAPATGGPGARGALDRPLPGAHALPRPAGPQRARARGRARRRRAVRGGPPL